MNLDSINKWLDEEYGISYTRLEELHDFYFEKYTEQKIKCNALTHYLIKQGLTLEDILKIIEKFKGDE